MGFHDLIAYQYSDRDAEQVLRTCQGALPGILAVIRTLEERNEESR